MNLEIKCSTIASQVECTITHTADRATHFWTPFSDTQNYNNTNYLSRCGSITERYNRRLKLYIYYIENFTHFWTYSIQKTINKNSSKSVDLRVHVGGFPDHRPTD